MTKYEKFYSMRGCDLVQYCIDHNIRVSQTRGQLKENKANVVNRILAAESGEPEPEWKEKVDMLLEEFKTAVKNNPNGDATKYKEAILELNNDAAIYFMEHLNDT